MPESEFCESDLIWLHTLSICVSLLRSAPLRFVSLFLLIFSFERSFFDRDKTDENNPKPFLFCWGEWIRKMFYAGSLETFLVYRSEYVKRPINNSVKC